MTRRCMVCEHPDLASIDAALTPRVEPLSAIALRFGLAQSVVGHHYQRHVLQLGEGPHSKGGARPPRKTCAVCASEERNRIDQCLHAGLLAREIQEGLGVAVNRYWIGRHRKNCLGILTRRDSEKVRSRLRLKGLVEKFKRGEQVVLRKKRRLLTDEEKREKDRQRARVKGAVYRANLREAVLRAYGGACGCCGETEPAMLAVDHLFGDGAEHRRQLSGSAFGNYSGTRFYLWLKSHGFPREGFQLLCHNCNIAKGSGRRCPHERLRLVDLVRCGSVAVPLG